MQVTSSRPYISPLELQTQREETTEKAKEVGILGYKVTKKIGSILKSAVEITEAFDENAPKSLGEITITLKVFKIFNAILALPKLYKSIKTVIRPGDLKDRIFGGWTLVKCVKKIVLAVETIFYYLNKLNLIAKATLAWTTITGYIFMPITFISAAVDIYQLNVGVQFMKKFNGKITVIKQEVAAAPLKKSLRLAKNQEVQEKQIALMRSVEKTKRICKHILVHKKSLEEYGVIASNCPIDDRLSSVIKQLKSRNEETKLKGIEAANHLTSRIKDRLKERIAIETVGTTLSVAGVATTVIGLACPPAAPALAIVATVLTIVGIARFAYSKFIPSGDILDTEKRMLFSTAGKKLKVAKKMLNAQCVKFKQNVYNFTQSTRAKLNLKPHVIAVAA